MKVYLRAHLFVDSLAGEHHAAEEGLDVVQLRVRGRALQRLLHAQLQVQRLRLRDSALVSVTAHAVVRSSHSLVTFGVPQYVVHMVEDKP
jgi:hypothetical protein